MRASSVAGLLFSVFSFGASSSYAGVCDYRLSELLLSNSVSDRAVGTAAAGVMGAGAAGTAFSAAGFYLIVNGTTGATMVGSTMAGASAAGTVGILSGTSGIVGTAASIVSAPITVFVAGVAAVGEIGLEGGCYFADERITDYDSVLNLMRKVAAQEGPAEFMLVNADLPGHVARIVVHVGPAKYDGYDVSELYVVNGELMNDDWFLNTDIGNIKVVIGNQPKN